MFTGTFLAYDSLVDYDRGDFWESIGLQIHADPPNPRPLEVLQLFADGLTLAEIAANMGITESTAKQLMGRARNSFCARTRTSAVFVALCLGVVLVTYPDGERGLSTGSITANGVGDELTQGEEEIIYLLAEGFLTNEIQARLGIPWRSKYNREVRRLGEKMGATNRESMIRRAYEVGVIGRESELTPVWFA